MVLRPVWFRRLAAAASGIAVAMALQLWAQNALAQHAVAQGLPTQTPVTTLDDRGQRITLPAPPQRIVSLLPALTETLCALDACGRLVGIDRWSNWPAQVTALPKLGGMDDVQLEALIRLKPDVVLASRAHRVLDRLTALGIPVVAFDGQNHRDIQRHLRSLGALLGEPHKADAAWAHIEQQFDHAAKQLQNRWHGQKVYVEISTALHTASAASFIGETLTRMGLTNIAPSEMGPFPQLNPEYILRAQPDLVLAVAREVPGMKARPGWHALRALRDGRVCAFKPEQWDVIVRPGPRVGEAALAVASCLERLP